MKSLMFDSGPIISLTMNNLLWIVEPLKKVFRGDFYIPESVKAELVDDPLKTKKFKFEALQIQELITNGTLKVLDDDLTKPGTLFMLELANSCFQAYNRNLTLVHYGEIASVVAAQRLNSVLVMDERITRELVEHPEHLSKLMQKKLHTKIQVNLEKVEEFKKQTQNLKIIRSTELAAVAFEKGLLNKYLSAVIPNPRKAVLESILWGLKLNGCAINERGIKAIMAAELKK